MLGEPETERREEAARAQVEAVTGRLPHHIVLSRDRLRAVDRLVVLFRNQIVAAANLAAEPARHARRKSVAEGQPQVEVGLHGEEGVRRSVRILDVVVGEGPAQIPAEREPGRQWHRTVQEGAVSAEGRQVLAGGVATVVVDEAATRGRVVALVAVRVARAELPLRKRLGASRAEQHHGDDHEPDARETAKTRVHADSSRSWPRSCPCERVLIARWPWLDAQRFCDTAHRFLSAAPRDCLAATTAAPAGMSHDRRSTPSARRCKKGRLRVFDERRRNAAVMAMRVRLVADRRRSRGGSWRAAAGGCGNASRSFGDVIMTVTVPEGVQVQSAEYTLDDKVNVPSEGVMGGSQPERQFVELIAHVPVSDHYVATVQAESVDGQIICEGSAIVTVMNGVTSRVQVALKCGGHVLVSIGVSCRDTPLVDLPGFAALGVRRRLRHRTGRPRPPRRGVADLHLVRAVGDLRRAERVADHLHLHAGRPREGRLWRSRTTSGASRATRHS